MKYYIAIIIQNGYTFYLSKIKPFSSIKSNNKEWYAYIGPQVANRFKTKEETMDAIATFCIGRGEVVAGVAEINYYKVNGGSYGKP